jgi:hypothetical protein
MKEMKHERGSASNHHFDLFISRKNGFETRTMELSHSGSVSFSFSFLSFFSDLVDILARARAFPLPSEKSAARKPPWRII